jgi:hypothetical protein
MLANEYILDYDYDICVTDEILGQIKSLDNAADNFVKDIVAFNCGKIGKNINDVLIEYYFERPEYNVVRSTKNKTPIISSVTFLNGAPNTMAVFTDLSHEVYKYKKYRNYKNGKKMFVSIPEKNKHIIYNGANCSLFINRDSSTVPIALFMNVFGLGNCLSDKHIIVNDTKCAKIEINNRFNFDFYENLLYKKNSDCIKFVWMILDERAKCIEFTDTYDVTAERTKLLKNKYGDVIQDIIEINKSNFKLNRFFQRFQIKNVLSKNICKWFIDETDKYVGVNGWETENFKNYSTCDIKLSNLKTVHDYFLKYELEKVMELIVQSYCLPKGTQFNITDLNIIKYSSDLISGLSKHTDSAFIAFNISLNSQFEYEGGGTYFDDGLTFKNDTGDLLIHCGKIEHIGLPVNIGARYILVGFINIKYDA